MSFANQCGLPAIWFKSAHLRSFAIFCACGVFIAAVDARVASAQTSTGGVSTTQTSTDVNTQATTNANPTASVIVQSISGGTSYRPTPNAPGLPSFAGGPCIGTTMAASTAIPGVSLGGGVSKEDESCQRRNWIQTLIGAAQHMQPEDALIMNRLAFQIMREDKYLAGPMERVGIPQLVEEERQKTATVKPARAKRVAEPKPVARMASVCTVVVPKSRPDAMVALLAARGCAVVVK